VYYLTHISEKNSSDHNGIESYIFENWKEDDISWFPIGRSLDLIEEEVDEESKKNSVDNVWKNFVKKHGEVNVLGHGD
jgi:hypothetical protein